jgi:hypothetical protein
VYEICSILSTQHFWVTIWLGGCESLFSTWFYISMYSFHAVSFFSLIIVDTKIFAHYDKMSWPKPGIKYFQKVICSIWKQNTWKKSGGTDGETKVCIAPFKGRNPLFAILFTLH